MMITAAEPAEDAGAPGAPVGDTGKRISGWLKSKAATLEVHVKEIRDTTKSLAQDVAKNLGRAQSEDREDRFEVTFSTRALGLELDLNEGAVVRLVKPGGQAELLQVKVMDRLVAIQGEPLPAPDEAGFADIVKQRMSSMPRPVSLTFGRLAPPAPAQASSAQEPQPLGADDGDQLMDLVKQRMPKLTRPVGLSFGRSEEAGGQLQAELASAREQLQRCEDEVAAARADAAATQQDLKTANSDAVAAVEEAAALRADLADLQLSKVWGAQEAQRSLAEAESANSAAVEARSEASKLRRELERSAGEFAAVEQELARERQARSEERAEAEELRQRAGQATANAAELVSTRQQLAEEFEQVRRELSFEQAASQESAQQASNSRAVLEAQLREIEELRSAADERVQQLEQGEASTEERISAMVLEAESLRQELQRREAHYAASEKLVSELRREVERLRSDVQRHEAAAVAAGLDTHEASRSELEELSVEVERLKSLAERHESRATAALAEVARLHKELERAPPAEVPLPCPEPELIGKEAGEEAEDRLAELEQQVRDLQAEKGTLSKQLSARPIVYQFAPLPDDVEPAEGVEVEEEVRDEPESRSALLLAWAAAIWCRRRTVQGLIICRKQRLAQWWEQSLRHFTKSLLQRPLLLWLFYTHVIVLWFLEFWRQAMSTPVEADPSNGLQRMVDKASQKP